MRGRAARRRRRHPEIAGTRQLERRFRRAGLENGQKVASKLPIFSPETVFYIETAIAQYQQIVAAGGWPQVPASKKLKLGDVDLDVEALRKRLMISGDLSRRAGMSQSYDTYVDAAVKRPDASGLPADGVLGKYSYAAMNISAQIRLGQLETTWSGYAPHVRLPRRPLCDGQRSRRADRSGGEYASSRATAIVGKIDRQTPIELQDQRGHRQSVLERARIDRAQGHHSDHAEGSPIPRQEQHPHPRPRRIEIDPTTIDWNTGDAAKFRFRQDPGTGNAMASVKINFPSPDGVYMHDTPQQSLFNKLMRFDSSGCVRVQNVRDLVTWLLRDTPGWTCQQFEQAIKSGQNIPIELTQPVPVYFTYISAWSTGDEVVQFRDDIYGRDGVDELQISSTGPLDQAAQ